MRGKKRQLTGSRFTDQQQKTEENDEETPRKISKLLHNNRDTTPKHRIFENSGKIVKLGLKNRRGTGSEEKPFLLGNMKGGQIESQFVKNSDSCQ